MADSNESKARADLAWSASRLLRAAAEIVSALGQDRVVGVDTTLDKVNNANMLIADARSRIGVINFGEDGKI